MHKYLKNDNVARLKPFSRLVDDDERRWTDENIDVVGLKHFPNIDKEKGLTRPILYSNWLSKVNQDDHAGNDVEILSLKQLDFHFTEFIICGCRTTSQWNRRS